MTVTFERNMGNGTVLFIGALILRDTDAAARAVALALAEHGGGIVVGRNTSGRIIVSAQGREDGSWVESQRQEVRKCAGCGDELGRYDFPSERYDGRICSNCAAEE